MGAGDGPAGATAAWLLGLREVGAVLDFSDLPVFEIGGFEGVVVGLALVEQPLEFARRHFAEGVAGDQRERDGGICVTDHTVWEVVGVDFSPTNGLSRGGAAESAGIRSSIGALEEVIMAAFFNTHDLLDLGFGLEHEIFRGTAT